AFGLLVYKIKETQGYNRIDIIVTYKEKLILIQCKNIEISISVQTVRVFKLAILRFSSNSLRIIVYNNKKLKEKKYATVKAKLWAQTSKRNIQICNEDKFVDIIKDFYELDNDDYIKLVDYKADSFNINSLLEENVSI
ncbi:22516_t:CDS:1, partial [Cetraspora pellucida]